MLALLAWLVFVDNFRESLRQLIVFAPNKKESKMHLAKVFSQGTEKNVGNQIEELYF